MQIKRVINYDNHEYSLMFHDENDHIGRQVEQTGTFYEIELLSVLRSLVSHDDIVIDVGANIGNHSIFFAGVAGCRVLAIEPVETASLLLRENVKTNNLIDRIFVREFALGSHPGHASVDLIDEANLGATRLRVEDSGTIRTKTLDAVRDNLDARINLVKIDVEGMELHVLEGAKRVLTEDQPLIICECFTSTELVKVQNELDKYGYQMTEVFNFTATYLFLPPGWIGSGSLSRQQYFEEALIRSNQRIRLIWDESLAIRKSVAKLVTKVDALERDRTVKTEI